MYPRTRIHVHSLIYSNRWRTAVYSTLIAFIALYFGTILPASNLNARYESLFGAVVWQDRNKTALPLLPNAKGNFTAPTEEVPPLFETLLLRKEDRYFYYHLGANPISMLRGFLSWMRKDKAGGGSTITQQLVKILRNSENNRTVKNKLIETFYAFALELHTSKRTECLN